MEAKRPRMETVSEAHMSRTPPNAGGVVLPLPHAVQDSFRATVEVKKVGFASLCQVILTVTDRVDQIIGPEIWEFCRKDWEATQYTKH